jgi:hypothetical protein
MRGEQDGFLLKIQGIEKASPAPVDDAIDMPRLTSRASELFLQQPGSEQRRLLMWWKSPGGRQPADISVRTVRGFTPFEPGKL